MVCPDFFEAACICNRCEANCWSGIKTRLACHGSVGGQTWKGSQHYPIRFGQTVMELFMTNHEAVKSHVKKTATKLEKLSCKELKDGIYIYIRPPY